VLKTSRPALCRGLPRGLGLEHGIQDRQQFAHTGGQGNIGRSAVRPQPALEVAIEVLEAGIEPVEGGLNIRLDVAMGAGQTVLFRHPHLDPLPPALDQGDQGLGLVVLPGPGLQADRLAEVGQRLGVERVGLGQSAER